MPGGGAFDLAPGQFTDDGEMTVSLLRALVLGQGQYNPLTVAKAYSDWEASHPFDICNATSSALRIPKSDRNGVRVADLIAEQALDFNSESKANGSLMRATPLGTATANMTVEQAVAMACADARLTHPNPSCQVSTAAYVMAIRQLIQKPGDHKGAFAAALSHTQSTSEEVSQWLQDAQEAICQPRTPWPALSVTASPMRFITCTEPRLFKRLSSKRWSGVETWIATPALWVACWEPCMAWHRQNPKKRA